MAKRKRGSSGALSMTAAAAPKQDPYRFIRDGQKQKVKGQANVPTARQKQGALEIALSGVGGPIAGKLLGKAAGKLAGKAAAAGSKAASKVGKRMTGANRRRANRAANKSKETPNTATSPTSAPKPKNTGVGQQQPRTPKPKPTPKATPKATSGKSTPKRVVDIVKTAAGRGTPGYRTNVAQTVSKPESKLGFLGKAGQRRDVSKKDQQIAKNIRTGAKVGTGAGIGVAGTKLYDSIDPMPNNKKTDTTTPKKNREPTVDKMSGYQLADDTNIRSPRKAAPKPASKPAPEKDDGYRYYGKKGTGLGDFSRKFEFKYATPEQFEKDFGMHDGEQMGGRPGKSKMKTQGLNRSKRTGFSGRGAGAALRGF